MNFSIIFNDLFLKKKKLFLSSTGVGSRFLIKNIKQQKIFPKSKFKYFALEFCVLNLIVEREKFNKNINKYKNESFIDETSFEVLFWRIEYFSTWFNCLCLEIF